MLGISAHKCGNSPQDWRYEVQDMYHEGTEMQPLISPEGCAEASWSGEVAHD